MLTLNDIARFLDQFFAVHRFGDDQGGIYHHSTRPIHRFGLAVEPWDGLAEWAKSRQIDALFLHRPWKLEARLAPDIGVAAYHLAFDERLTLGFNNRLADVLEMSALEVVGEKEGRPIGMLGEIPTQSMVSYCSGLNEIFGGRDKVLAGVSGEVKRVAVVGAMTDALVREAALRKVDLYITGQLRQPAEAAVKETGISVVAVGHRRCEEWGLRALSGVLRDRYSKLQVVLPP